MYEAMPHVFTIALETCGLEAAKNFSDHWAGFCTMVAAGTDIDTRGTFYEAKTCKEREIDVEDLSSFSEEEVMRKMRAAQEARREGTEGEAKAMPRL